MRSVTPAGRAQSLRGLTFAVIAIGAFSCHDSPTGPPADVTITARFEWPDSASSLVGIAGQSLPSPISVLVYDRFGHPLGGAAIRWSVLGEGASVTPASAQTDAAGRAVAIWTLGTHSSETQRIDVAISSRHGSVVSLVRTATARPSVAALVVFDDDSLRVPLSISKAPGVHAFDAFGNRIADSTVQLATRDTSVAVTTSDRTLICRRRGRTVLIARAGDAADTLPLNVFQRVRQIETASDTLVFSAIGQRSLVRYTVVDDYGVAVRDTLAVLTSGNTVVAVAENDSTVRAISNGTAIFVLAVGGVQKAITARVKQTAALVTLTTHNARFDALEDTLRLGVFASDSGGTVISDPITKFAVSDSSVIRVLGAGLVVARATGHAIVRASVDNARDSTSFVVRPVPVALRHQADSIIFHSLGAMQFGLYWAVDRSGATISDAALRFAVGDTNLLSVERTTGRLTAKTNGRTFIHAWVDALHDSTLVTVRQRATRIVFPADTLDFDAIQQVRAIAAVALDSLGNRVADTLRNLVVSDPGIVELRPGAEATSIANGTTRATFSLAGLSGALPVRVRQVADMIQLERSDNGTGIISVPLNSLLPFRCSAFDRNGYPIDATPASVASANRVYSGARCDSLRLARSGRDTVEVRAGRAAARLAFAAAAPAIVAPGVGTALVLDSQPPASSHRWAPTLRRNSRGQFELYASVYTYTNAGDQIGDLHRWVSDDGTSYRWDGIVIRRDTTLCSPRGTGVENIAIIPRQDGPGWRMYFAGGSFNCYGWQVFSAVSEDERNWTVESGVRLDNGGQLSSPAQGPWPVGEGMSVDRASDGEWRMVVGGYERTDPPHGAWQIVEWRSTDQINWHSVGPVLRTQNMPFEARHNIYSPTISEIGPGIYRMIFTGDNRYDADGRSRLWTALSTDMATWQLEGKLIDEPGWNILYSTLADGHLVFLRRTPTDSTQTVAGVTIVQP